MFFVRSIDPLPLLRRRPSVGGLRQGSPEEQDVGLGLVGHVVDPALKKRTTGIEPSRVTEPHGRVQAFKY